MIPLLQLQHRVGLIKINFSAFIKHICRTLNWKLVWEIKYCHSLAKKTVYKIFSLVLKRTLMDSLFIWSLASLALIVALYELLICCIYAKWRLTYIYMAITNSYWDWTVDHSSITPPPASPHWSLLLSLEASSTFETDKNNLMQQCYVHKTQCESPQQQPLDSNTPTIHWVLIYSRHITIQLIFSLLLDFP